MLQVLDEPMVVEGKQLFASVGIGIMMCDQPAAPHRFAAQRRHRRCTAPNSMVTPV